MSTRRTTEAFKAFEGRRNSIMAQRRKSQMQTLGANNIYGVTGNPLGIQGRPSRSSQISVKDVFEGHGATSAAGHVNAGYEGDDSPVNSLRLQNLGQVTWREANSNVWSFLSFPSLVKDRWEIRQINLKSNEELFKKMNLKRTILFFRMSSLNYRIIEIFHPSIEGYNVLTLTCSINYITR